MLLHRRAPPELPVGMLLRARLLSTLLARFEHRVVVITAPAGFGKTTLLAQAIGENGLSPRGIDAWLSCEPADADASVLLAGLAAGVGADPVAASVATICEAVLARVPLPVALVVDDVHEIAGESEAAAVLDELVHALPANGHLVLAGRREPPVRLSRLDATGAVAHIGEADLRFTDDELGALAVLHGRAQPDLDDTGGWPALAALRLRAGSVPPQRFVWEEVLGRLDRRAQIALATLVAVDGADPELLDIVVGAHVDTDELRATVPLLELRGGTIRAHALWSTPVAGLLTDDEVRAARRRAARVLQSRGELARAAALVLPAVHHDEEWVVVQDLIADGCTIARWVAHADLLASWWAAFPDDRRSAPAGLLLRASIDRLNQVIGEDSRPVLEEALAAVRDAGLPRIELAVISQLAHVAWWQDDLATLVVLQERVSALAEEGLAEAEGPLGIGRAMVAQLGHDHERMLGEIDRIDRSTLDPGMAAGADWLHVRALVALGRAEEGIPIADRAAEHPSFAFRAAQAERVFTRWFSGRFFEAAQLLAELEASGDRLPRDRFLIGVVTAGGHAMLGEVEAARRCADVAAATIGSVEGRRPRLFLGYTRALISVAAGNDAGAADELRTAIADEPLGYELLDTMRVLIGTVHVLLPERRAELAAIDLGPDQRVALAVADAFVRTRAGEATSTAIDVERLLSVLGLRWTVEFASRTGDAALAQTLVERFGPRARDLLHGDPLLRALPAPPKSPLYLRVLGPTVLERDGAPVSHPDWRRERVRSLLLLLVIRRRVSREVVATTLWPDLDAEAALGNLRVTLRYLHRVLEPGRPPGDAPWYVRAEGDALRLVDEYLAVDAWEMEAALDEAAALDAAGVPSAALPHYEAGLELWRGDFMADVYDDWAALERERRRARFLAASVRAGELLLGTGDNDRTLSVAIRAVEAEPWSEAAHRLVMAAHLARGDRAAARRALERCTEALTALGVEPDEATVMLERAIRDPARRDP